MKRSTLYAVVAGSAVILVGAIYFSSLERTALPETEHERQAVEVSADREVVSENVEPVQITEGGGTDGSKPQEDGGESRPVVTAAKNQGDTINIRDYGVLGNGRNETAAFQRALNAAAGKILYIPKQQGSYYLTRQLRVPSNSTLVFHSGVIVQATDDLKQAHADFEALIRIENSNNVVIKGNNALFRMNKAAYKGEHNHIFMINGASNVTIEKARANDSGGDGFYIGAYKTSKQFCENIKIIDCSGNNNRRQGLSIITVKNVLIDNGKFDGSTGADPETGIDIEPSKSTDILQGIKIRNVTASGNKKRGFLVLLNRLNAQSTPVDIVFENCVAEGNMEGFSTRQTRGVQGKVEFINCTARNSRVTGFTESSSLANSVKKIYRNCTAENSNTANRKMDGYKFKASYYIAGNAKRKEVIGNSEFINCKSIVNGELKTVDYGIVIDNGDTDVKSIVLNKFEITGNHNKEKLYAPKKTINAITVN